MARIPGRGTLFKATISAVLTTIAQTKSHNLGEQKSQVVDTEATDDVGVGINMTNIGTVSQDESTFELFYDPDSTVQQFITDSIAAPAAFPIACSVVWADAAPASSLFNAIGFGWSTSAATKDVAMARLTVIHNGPIVYPT